MSDPSQLPPWFAKLTPFGKAIGARAILVGVGLFVILVCQVALQVVVPEVDREELADRAPWSFLIGLVVGTALRQAELRWAVVHRFNTWVTTSGILTIALWGFVLSDAFGSLYLVAWGICGAIIPVLIWGPYPFPARSRRSIDPGVDGGAGGTEAR